MSIVQLLRNNVSGLNRLTTVCVAALSILLARGLPPTELHLNAGSALHSFSNHDHRQCLDHDASEWEAFCGTKVRVPPPVAAHDPVPTVAPCVDLLTDGWHFNRPPPLC